MYYVTINGTARPDIDGTVYYVVLLLQAHVSRVKTAIEKHHILHAIYHFSHKNYNNMKDLGCYHNVSVKYSKSKLHLVDVQLSN